MSRGPEVQRSKRGQGGGGRDSKESAGGLRPQLNPGVRERREEAMETEVKART